MACFLDLPEELIFRTITFIPPEDFENCAQSCSRLHSVASSALEKHRLLIGQYSSMKHRGGRTISNTLKEVLVNPETGRYTLNISLNYMGDTQESFNLQYKTEDLEVYFSQQG